MSGTPTNASAAEPEGLPTKAELQRLTDALKKLQSAIHAAIVGQETDDSAVAHISAWRYERILSLNHPAATLHAELKSGDCAAFLCTEDGIARLPAGKFWNAADAKRAFITGALSVRSSRIETSAIETKSGTATLRITDMEEFRKHYLAKIGFSEQPTPAEQGAPLSLADDTEQFSRAASPDVKPKTRKPRRDETRPEIIEALKTLAASSDWKGRTDKERCILIARHLEKPAGWCKPWTLRRAVTALKN
jgi:hypothetical protein